MPIVGTRNSMYILFLPIKLNTKLYTCNNFNIYVIETGEGQKKKYF
jgi:hypothetical protein